MGTTSGGGVDESRSEKPQAHKSEARPHPVLPAPWLRLAHGVGRVGEGQRWEETEIWDLGLVEHAIAPGVHKGAAHTGTSPGIFPRTSGWGLPCLQRCKRIPFQAVPRAAPIQRVLATPGAWATESEGDGPTWQEGRLGCGQSPEVTRRAARLRPSQCRMSLRVHLWMPSGQEMKTDV